MLFLPEVLAQSGEVVIESRKKFLALGPDLLLRRFFGLIGRLARWTCNDLMAGCRLLLTKTSAKLVNIVPGGGEKSEPCGPHLRHERIAPSAGVSGRVSHSVPPSVRPACTGQEEHTPAPEREVLTGVPSNFPARRMRESIGRVGIPDILKYLPGAVGILFPEPDELAPLRHRTGFGRNSEGILSSGEREVLTAVDLDRRCRES